MVVAGAAVLPGGAIVTTIRQVEEEPLISRDELTGYLFTVVDIKDHVAAIRRMLEEDDDGWEAEEDA